MCHSVVTRLPVWGQRHHLRSARVHLQSQPLPYQRLGHDPTPTARPLETRSVKHSGDYNADMATFSFECARARIITEHVLFYKYFFKWARTSSFSPIEVFDLNNVGKGTKDTAGTSSTCDTGGTAGTLRARYRELPMSYTIRKSEIDLFIPPFEDPLETENRFIYLFIYLYPIWIPDNLWSGVYIYVYGPFGSI
eukprot:SAG31_NODE_1097_length_9920_cov_5.942165_3_plen_194_part_00